MFKEYHYDKFLNNPSLLDDFVPAYARGEFQKYCGKRTSKRYKYVMFTINFKEGVDMDDVKKKYVKYVMKKWLLKSMSCFEWRKMDKGMHIHSKVWLDEEKNPYECKREVYKET